MTIDRSGTGSGWSHSFVMTRPVRYQTARHCCVVRGGPATRSSRYHASFDRTHCSSTRIDAGIVRLHRPLRSRSAGGGRRTAGRGRRRGDRRGGGWWTRCRGGRARRRRGRRGRWGRDDTAASAAGLLRAAASASGLLPAAARPATAVTPVTKPRRNRIRVDGYRCAADSTPAAARAAPCAPTWHQGICGAFEDGLSAQRYPSPRSDPSARKCS